MKFSTLVFLLLLAPLEPAAFEWIAHRANANGEVENSLDATKAAREIPADMVELDVRVSDDGVVYLYHDGEVDGTNLGSLNFAEIRALTSETHTPTLDSILALGDPWGAYLLDLKETRADRALAILRAVMDSGVSLKKVVFQSWDTNILKALQSKHPDGRYFYLNSLNRETLLAPTPTPNDVFAHVAGLELEGVSLKSRRFIDRAFIAYFHRRGLKVFIWTVNNFDQLKYYRDIGVDGIISDDISGLKKRFSLLRQ